MSALEDLVLETQPAFPPPPPDAPKIAQPSAGCRYLLLAGPNADDVYDMDTKIVIQPLGWECVAGAFLDFGRVMEVAAELDELDMWTQIVDLKTLTIIFRTDIPPTPITFH